MLRHCDQRSGGFTMTKSNLRLVSPHTVIGTVPPRRVPNAELRTREYLTEAEVERLTKAAKANRNGQRDGAMILIAIQAWPTRGGIGRSAMGSGGPWPQCVLARAPSQKWDAERASIARR